jgi:hypothetical protein
MAADRADLVIGDLAAAGVEAWRVGLVEPGEPGVELR